MYVIKIQTWYPYGCFIIDKTCQTAWWRWLFQDCESTQVFKGKKVPKMKPCFDDLCIVKWWLDASYAIHKYCKGNTGATMSLGKGNISSFQLKIYTSQDLHRWLYYWYTWCTDTSALDQVFYRSTGVHHGIKHHTARQQKIYPIRGEWKVIKFKEKKSHQDKILLIKDMIEKCDVEVTYCPTQEMWSDVLPGQL